MLLQKVGRNRFKHGVNLLSTDLFPPLCFIEQCDFSPRKSYGFRRSRRLEIPTVQIENDPQQQILISTLRGYWISVITIALAQNSRPATMCSPQKELSHNGTGNCCPRLGPAGQLGYDVRRGRHPLGCLVLIPLGNQTQSRSSSAATAKTNRRKAPPSLATTGRHACPKKLIPVNRTSCVASGYTCVQHENDSLPALTAA